MDEKFEFASADWIAEAFRIVRKVARENPHLTLSFCEVFTQVPKRLHPDHEGKVAWSVHIRNGRASLVRGEVPAEAVDLKTVAEWEAILPSARYEIDLDDPDDLVRCHALTAEAVEQGRIQRLGDRSKAPPVLLLMHNAMAKRTA